MNPKANLRLCTSVLLSVSALLSTAPAHADSGTPADARARYQQDRAACDRGQTAEDKATCLREAGAAFQESSRGHLIDAGASLYQQNALLRCTALPPSDREACRARMQGQGTVSGSVAGGGLLREYVEEVPAVQDNVTPGGAAPASPRQ